MKKIEGALTQQLQGVLYADVPMERIARSLPAGMQAAHIQFVVELQLHDGTQLTYENGKGIISEGIIVEKHAGPLRPDEITEGIIEGEKWGVDWDISDLRESCVLAARAFVEEAFAEYYGNVELPKLDSLTETNFNGAARYMMDVLNYDAEGNEINGEDGEQLMTPEMEVPDFTKVYLKNVPTGTLPPVGALLVWNQNVGGGFGHIAIVVGVRDDGTIIVFDGNWLEDDQDNKYVGFHEVTNMQNVIGWMTPKPLTQ